MSLCVVVMMLFPELGKVNAAEQKLPEVEIKHYKGKPTIFIDGKPVALAGYSPGNSRSFYDKYMPLFYKHKMGVYLIWLGPGIAGNEFWDGDNILSEPVVKNPQNAFTTEDQVKHIMQGDPGAYIIVRFYTRPPGSWKKLHPSEFFINEEGEMQGTPSLASDRFWEKSAELSAVIIRYIESRPWGNRVIGYNTHYLEEGTHMPVADGWLFDHNPLMIKRFRGFLKNKYGTVEKLQFAYDDSTLTFENVEVPKDRLRRPVPEVTLIPYWQNSKDNQSLRDYLELQRDLWHLRFRQAGKAMENAADRNVLILHDALKQTMLGWNLKGFFGYSSFGEKVSWSSAFPELIAGSGHMDVASLFDDTSGFDGLLTPHDYQARGIGGVFEPEGIADSAILRGKYFLCEMDTRSGDYGIGAARNAREWAAITWRNFAVSWARGFQSYWMYGFQIAEWFGTEPIQKVIRRQVDAINESVNWHHETVPVIAMILDDSAVLETNGSGNYFNEAIMWEQKMGLARCGVPFRIYLFEDLALDNFPKHKVFYFPNLFKVDDAKLELLKRNVFRDGNVVVWGPGSGISDGEKIGTESAAKLTGFEFTLLPANAQRRILISNFEHPVTIGLDEATIIGGPLAYGPVLIPTDGTELGLAWAKGGMNHIGLSLKKFGMGAAGDNKGKEILGKGDYAAVFTTAVPLPSNLWRNLARYAGAHVYCESNDILLADNNIVALHSLKSGRKHIALPGKFHVLDLITDKVYSHGTREIVFDLEAPETRVFQLLQ